MIYQLPCFRVLRQADTMIIIVSDLAQRWANLTNFKVIQKEPIGTWKFDKIGVLVNFIFEELKFYKFLKFCLNLTL